jgi:hypothetical protein
MSSTFDNDLVHIPVVLPFRARMLKGETFWSTGEMLENYYESRSSVKNARKCVYFFQNRHIRISYTLAGGGQTYGFLHEWLGCTFIGGIMYELDADGNEISPQRMLTGGLDGEVAYIIQRRATLESFLEFLSGANQHDETYWISEGLGVAQLLIEYQNRNQNP